jgi:ring-1,2-phenylacetyl-CoA epoxidase subunit PaaE
MIVTVYLYSEEHKILVKDDESILQAAMENGLDPPFSCQLGVCGTCRAKLKAGKVDMDDRDALTDEDIENGYVLTCQSHPVTEDVYVDYDDI